MTLAEVLRDAGYETAAVVGGPLLRALYGHDQGFGLYDDSTARSAGKRTGASPRRRSSTGPSRGSATGTSEARDVPFFLFLHLWDVHYDYAPPPPYDAMFDPDYAGDLDATNFDAQPGDQRGHGPRAISSTCSPSTTARSASPTTSSDAHRRA